MSEGVLLYSTFGDLASAKEVGRCLVEERLVACVNVVPGVHSLFFWEGKVQGEEEVLFLAKTTEALALAARERLEVLHPYEVPCVLAFTVDGVAPGFMAWVKEQVK